MVNAEILNSVSIEDERTSGTLTLNGDSVYFFET